MNSLQYDAPISNPTEETSDIFTWATTNYFHSAQTLANNKLSQQHERNSGNASNHVYKQAQPIKKENPKT